MEKVDIVVVGATGAVAEVLFEILAQRDFPVGEVYALASERSVGDFIIFKNKKITVEKIDDFDFAQTQLAFFCVGSDISKQYIPKATAAGCVVIDKSNVYRLDPEVPLVVPEVNAHAIAGFTKKNVIANPNCSTIQLVMALKPLQDAAGLKRVSVCTYQAASGAGKQGIEELAANAGALLNGQTSKPKVFPKQLAFNVIPQIDIFETNGYTGEELKIIYETQKILELPELPVNATAVRVGVFHGHSEAVDIETQEKLTAQKAREVLKKFPGIKVIDKDKAPAYPTALDLGSDTDEVLIGRIREDLFIPNALSFWIVADNLRKGAALNAVEIAEILVNEYF